MSHAEQIEALKGLLERVRAAEGADREIDYDIARWEGWTQHSDADDPVYARTVSQWWAEPGCEWSTTSVPAYVTRGLDDAFALAARILPEWDTELHRAKCGLCIASMTGPDFSDDDLRQYAESGVRPTGGLAVCEALLSAKLALLTQEEGR